MKVLTHLIYRSLLNLNPYTPNRGIRVAVKEFSRSHLDMNSKPLQPEPLNVVTEAIDLGLNVFQSV